MSLSLALDQRLDDKAKTSQAQVDLAGLFGTLAFGVCFRLSLAAGQVDQVQLPGAE